MNDRFAVFICTHGRPDKQYTLNTLRKLGYTGNIYLVLDNTDSTIQQYIDNYGINKLIIFDKNYYINSDEYDNGDNEPHYKCIVYAKRAVEDIAKSMKLKYFAISDDDITNFVIRYPSNNKLCTCKVDNFDAILNEYVKFLIKPVAGIGFGYVTSYFRGSESFSYNNLCVRKLPYQFVLRNSSIDVKWTSWMAEDDITEIQSSVVGNVWLSIPYIMQVMKPIGDIKNNGGMVDTYKSQDNFTLKFNIVKYHPRKTYYVKKKNEYVLSSKKEYCYPKIISEVYKK